MPVGAAVPEVAYEAGQPFVIGRREIRGLHPRKADGRRAPERRLARDAERARIDEVLGDVAAVVDAGKHEIRLGVVLEQPGESGDDAVGRTAGTGIAPFAETRHDDRFRHGQGRAGGRMLRLRRDDPHVVAQTPRRRLQPRDAGGFDAVVVRDQDAHSSSSGHGDAVAGAAFVTQGRNVRLERGEVGGRTGMADRGGPAGPFPDGEVAGQRRMRRHADPVRPAF